MLWKRVSLCAPRSLGTCLLGCLLVCGFSRTVLAQYGDAPVINREYKLKALFLYNFGSYVEWPPSAFQGITHPFVIGILGSSPVQRTLHEIAAAKRINGRRIVVEHYASAGGIKHCQILFIARDVSPQDRKLAIERLRDQYVLIVGESNGFAGGGAIVNFFVENNRIRFEINLDAARRHKLTISSKLLALAKIVESNGAASH